MKQKKNKKAAVNGALRQWARGISFTIAMGRRQVFMLVSMHISQAVPVNRGLVGSRHRHLAHFITSAHCLDERGLLAPHVWRSEKIRLDAQREGSKLLMRDLWQLTRAGELVIELLKEAGIYEEVRAELELADEPKLRIA